MATPPMAPPIAPPFTPPDFAPVPAAAPAAADAIDDCPGALLADLVPVLVAPWDRDPSAEADATEAIETADWEAMATRD